MGNRYVPVLEIGLGVTAAPTEEPGPTTTTFLVIYSIASKYPAHGIINYSFPDIAHFELGYPNKLVTGKNISFRGYCQVFNPGAAAG